MVSEPPDELTCPLTHDILRDPVLLHTAAGRSYERAALEEHQRRRPRLDPFTTKKHSHRLQFPPNGNLQNSIETWLRERNITLEPLEPVSAHDAARKLVAAQDASTRKRAARALTTFCRNDDPDNKIAARQAGAIPVLVAMLGYPNGMKKTRLPPFFS